MRLSLPSDNSLAYELDLHAAGFIYNNTVAECNYPRALMFALFLSWVFLEITQ